LAFVNRGVERPMGHYFESPNVVSLPRAFAEIAYQSSLRKRPTSALVRHIEDMNLKSDEDSRL